MKCVDRPVVGVLLLLLMTLLRILTCVPLTSDSERRKLGYGLLLMQVLVRSLF